MQLLWLVKDFIFQTRFESKKHIQEYVTLVESLIRQGRQRVMTSEEEVQEAVLAGTCPTVDTSNQIRMMYSIMHSPAGFHHHFSVSRKPYLASRYAKHLAALFCKLAGLNAPEKLYVGKYPIYHLETVLIPEEHAKLEKDTNLDYDAPKEVFLKAFMDSIPVTIERLDSPVE